MAKVYWTDGGADGDWGNTSNWSTGSVPANSDDVYIEQSSRTIDTNLNQSAVALSSLNIAQNFTGQIGTEDSALQIGSSTVNIGYTKGPGAAAGSTRLHIDLGTTAATVTVYGSASSSATDSTHPIRLIANSSTTDIFIRAGSVSVMDFPSESGEVREVAVTGSSGSVRIGQDADSSDPTVATLTTTAGQANCYVALTALNCDGGTIRTANDGAVTTANVRAGTLISNSTGTISTLNVEGGTADFLQSNQSRTVTTVNLEPGGSFFADPDVVTLTNGVALSGSDPLRISAS